MAEEGFVRVVGHEGADVRGGGRVGGEKGGEVFVEGGVGGEVGLRESDGCAFVFLVADYGGDLRVCSGLEGDFGGVGEEGEVVGVRAREVGEVYAAVAEVAGDGAHGVEKGGIVYRSETREGGFGRGAVGGLDDILVDGFGFSGSHVFGGEDAPRVHDGSAE